MATTKVQSELIADDVALAGNPTTSTQSAGNNTTRIATTAFVTTAINNLINSAPGTLDTLDEIAAALNDDPSFTTTVNNAIALKAPLANPTFTGTATAPAVNISAGTPVLTLTDTSSSATTTITLDGVNTTIDSNGTDGDLIFKGSDGGSEIEAMRIDYSAGGKLGLGTDAPSKLFTMQGADCEFMMNRTGSYADTINMGMPGGVPTIVGGTDLAFGGTGTWTEHMRIKADGKVGIGTDSPSKHLHIKSTASEDTGIIIENTNNAQNLDIDYWNNAGAVQGRIRYAEGAGKFLVYPNTSASVALTVLWDGKVGIGNDDPAYTLHVEGAGSVAGLISRSGSGTNSFENTMIIDCKTSNDAADGYGPALYFTFTDSGVTRSEIANISVIRDGADNSGQMQFGVRNAGTWDYDAMVIDSTSKVGIGNPSPEYPLQIDGSNVSSGGGLATVGIIDTGTDYNGTSPGGGIAFRGKYNNGGSTTNFATVQGVKENTTDGNYASAIRFTTRSNGGNLTEKMRITSAGNVLIGTTNADVGGSTTGINLKETGAALFSMDETGTYNQPLYADRRGTNNTGTVLAMGMGGYFKAAIDIHGTNSGTDDAAISFNTWSGNTTKTERMRITSAGTVNMPSQARMIRNLSSAQTIATSTNTVIDWTTNESTVGITYSSGEFTVVEAGVYVVHAYARFQSTSTGHACYITCHHKASGGSFAEIAYDYVSGCRAYHQMNINRAKLCAAGDVMRILVWHNQGGNLDLTGNGSSCAISVTKVA